MMYLLILWPIKIKLKYFTMVISNLKNSSRVKALHPLFERLFDYVKSFDFLHAPLGRIELDGENLYIMNSEPDAVPQEKQLLELHHQYIDVHILLEGRERIGWKATEDLTQEVKAYASEGDCALYSDVPSMWIDLLPGQFVIVYPEDAHAPCIGEGKIRKLTAKVKL